MRILQGQTGLDCGGWPAIGVSRRVGRIVVRTEIGLDFDDASGHHTTLGSVDQQLAEQAGRDQFRRAVEEGAGKQAAGEATRNVPLRSSLPALIITGPICSSRKQRANLFRDLFATVFSLRFRDRTI